MALQAGDIADMIIAAQKDLGKQKLTDLTSDLQYHTALNQLIRKNRATLSSGSAIQFNVLMNPDDNARHTGLFDVDNVNQKDGLVTGEVPWRHTVTGYAIDVRQPIMGSGVSQVLDIYKEKRYQMLVGLAELMEEAFWGEPASSSDKTTPFGIKYWLVYNASEGHNGGNNANFSAGPAGIDRSTYPRWKNYTFQYTNVARDDLITKARKAMWSCGFKPAITNPPIGQYGSGKQKYGLYTTYDILAAMELLAEDQNDRLGPDLASMDGRVTLRRVTIEAVPYLQQNEATADPFVGIDWDVFSVKFLRGRYMLESKPEARTNHNVVEGYLDNTYNFVCYDPRRCFLGAKSTWH